jgi:radical SAM protein with 4Fe4S-binding SPASM domain
MTKERYLEVFIDQINKCNLRCLMCAFSDERVRNLKKIEMDFEVFKKISYQIFPLARYVALSCLTEPLLLKDLPKRLELVKEKNVPFSEIITNGILLNEKIINSLIENEISRIGISLDGVKKGTYESIRIGASFEKLIENIKLLVKIKDEKKAKKPYLRLIMVLSEKNIDEFYDFLKMAKEFNASSIDIRTVTPFKGAKIKDFAEVKYWEKIKEYKIFLDKWCKENNIENLGYLRENPEKVDLYDEKGNKLYCRRPFYTVAIHPNGDINPCMTWMRKPLGNIKRQDFKEIWESEYANSLRKEFEEKKPGVDCQFCLIKKEFDEQEEDGFFKMLSKE